MNSVVKIEMTYSGHDGALKTFLIANASESQIDRLKEITRGYSSMQVEGGIRFKATTKTYEAAQKFVAAQASIATAPAVQASIVSAAKNRVLIPANFSNSDVINLVGDVTLSGRGATFYINEDHASTHGSHLLGYEGCAGQYAYYTN